MFYLEIGQVCNSDPSVREVQPIRQTEHPAFPDTDREEMDRVPTSVCAQPMSQSPGEMIVVKHSKSVVCAVQVIIV